MPPTLVGTVVENLTHNPKVEGWYPATCTVREKMRGESFSNPYRYSGFLQVELKSHGLPHEDIGVVTGLKHALELFKLPLREVGPVPNVIKLFCAVICDKLTCFALANIIF